MIFLIFKVSIRDNSLAENETALEQGCALGVGGKSFCDVVEGVREPPRLLFSTC